MLRLVLAGGLAAASLSAQCASLAVTGTGAPGTSLVFTIDGTAAGALAALAIGDTLGTTTIPLGALGSLTLGLAQPFVPVPMGTTDANGDASLTIAVPGATTLGVDLHGQGVTMSFSLPGPGPGGPGLPTLTFCTTNVVSFHVGS